MSNITLNQDQDQAVKKFQEFLDSPEKEFLLTGFAGSGKSFLVNYFIKTIDNYCRLKETLEPETFTWWEVFLTATTNKAAKALQDNINKFCTTIHSLLGLKPKNDYKTGKVYLDCTNFSKAFSLPDKSIIFIDEASMISTELLYYIKQVVDNTNNTKIVYIGDPYQLTPVESGFSPVFESVNNKAFLSKVQRQLQGNPIIELSQEYRKILDNSSKPKKWPEIIPDNKNIFLCNNKEFEQAIVNHYNQPHNQDDLKILAWTNEQVSLYNIYVRKLYTSSDAYLPGEFVVVNDPHIKNGSVQILAETILQIKKIYPLVYDVYGIPGYSITLKPLQGHRTYMGFLPKSYSLKKAKLKEFARRKDWSSYFHIKESYFDLRPVHASTVHKAQGSTYQKVFIDFDDLKKNRNWKEIARLAYVAITRASEAIYIRGNL